MDQEAGQGLRTRILAISVANVTTGPTDNSQQVVVKPIIITQV